jgi:hypothetical protein
MPSASSSLAALQKYVSAFWTLEMPCSQKLCRVAHFCLSFCPPRTWSFAATKARASQILSGASRLLLYRSMLSKKPVESFMKLLRSLQHGNKDSITEAYSAFYLEVVSTKSLSWRDYVLEQVTLPPSCAYCFAEFSGSIWEDASTPSAYAIRSMSRDSCELLESTGRGRTRRCVCDSHIDHCRLVSQSLGESCQQGRGSGTLAESSRMRP